MSLRIVFKWVKDMICVNTMVDSLRLMQLLRLLKSGDNKSVSHIVAICKGNSIRLEKASNSSYGT